MQFIFSFFKKIFSFLLGFIVKRWKLLLILLIAAGIGFYFYQKSEAKKAEADLVVFEQVQEGDLIKTLEIGGIVDADKKARMSFAAGGKLTSVRVDEGDWVDQWNTMATIDRALINEQLETELNNYSIQRWGWENTLDTYAENSSGQRQVIPELKDRRTVDVEQFRLNNAVNAVEIRNIAIRDTVLSAPFSGIVTKVPTNTPGVQLGPNDYFEVVDPETLIFRAFVDEEDISQIRIDQLGEIELDAFEDGRVRSAVQHIAFTSTQAATGTTYAIEMPLSGLTSLPLRVGMNGDVLVEVDRSSNTLFVPINVTRERDSKVYVDVKTGDQSFEERIIEVGIETDDLIEVLSGLSKTDFVVLP